MDLIQRLEGSKVALIEALDDAIGVLNAISGITTNGNGKANGGNGHAKPARAKANGHATPKRKVPLTATGRNKAGVARAMIKEAAQSWSTTGEIADRCPELARSVVYSTVSLMARPGTKGQPSDLLRKGEIGAFKYRVRGASGPKKAQPE